MKKNKLEKQILKKIKKGEIEMKPKRYFAVKTWEKRLGIGVTAAATILSISGIGYFASKYQPRELMEFGSVGWQVFYEDFPYYWLAGAIACEILVIKIWFRLGNNYRYRAERIWLAATIVLLAIIGLTLFLN